jgi:hypothetical protein
MGKRNGQDTTALKAEIGVRALPGTRANIVYPTQHIIADGNAAHATVTVDQSARMSTTGGGRPTCPTSRMDCPSSVRTRTAPAWAPAMAGDGNQKSLKQGLQVAATGQVPRKIRNETADLIECHRTCGVNVGTSLLHHWSICADANPLPLADLSEKPAASQKTPEMPQKDLIERRVVAELP